MADPIGPSGSAAVAPGESSYRIGDTIAVAITARYYFGDPVPGSVKNLSITYKANGKTQSVTIQENTPIKLK